MTIRPSRLLQHLAGSYHAIDRNQLGVQATHWRLPPEWAMRTALEVIAVLLPGLRLFVGHPAYSTGVFECKIGDDGSARYSANRKDLLPFHSDMALLSSPPSVSVIRCVVPDLGEPPKDGAILLLHVSDLLVRLRELGRQDLLEFLHAVRPIRLADGSVETIVLVPEVLGAAPLRVFDRIGWQLSEPGAAHLSEVLKLCHSFEDLWVRVRLDGGEVLAFSNRHFLHSRAPCSSELRVTEICLGDLSTG